MSLQSGDQVSSLYFKNPRKNLKAARMDTRRPHNTFIQIGFEVVPDRMGSITLMIQKLNCIQNHE